MLDTCAKHDIGVLLDVHTAEGSQNGFDNSGISTQIAWANSTWFSKTPMPEWLTHWNGTSNTEINYDNYLRSINEASALLETFGNHSALIGYEPVNEPWWNTDLAALSAFYRDVRKLVQQFAPQAYFVFHDSFRPTAPEWKVLFDDYTKVAMDHHGYMAFAGYKQDGNVTEVCEHWDRDNNDIGLLTPHFEVWKGEWSFSLDVCAHWLQGFNYQQQVQSSQCTKVECPKLYFDCPSNSKFDCEVDKSIDVNGPFGINQWNNS